MQAYLEVYPEYFAHAWFLSVTKPGQHGTSKRLKPLQKTSSDQSHKIYDKQSSLVLYQYICQLEKTNITSHDLHKLLIFVYLRLVSIYNTKEPSSNLFFPADRGIWKTYDLKKCYKFL